MKPAVAEGVKQLISSRASELEHLSISWFGGEPLLARGVIREVMTHVCSLSKQYRNLDFASDITTNAWLLTRTVIEELVDLGVRSCQVTFDGPRRWHDKRRLRLDGEGTFDRIWSNLQAIRKSSRQFTIFVRIHVDVDNQSAIPGFIDQFRAGFDGDPRFVLFIRPLSLLGGVGDSELDTLHSEEDKDVFNHLWSLAENCGVEQLRPEDIPKVCYASRANAYVIRADGRVGKCSVALENPANQVGRINPDGTLSIDQSLMLTWMRGFASGDQEVLRCPLKGIPDPPASKAEGSRRAEELDRALRERLISLTGNEAPGC